MAPIIPAVEMGKSGFGVGKQIPISIQEGPFAGDYTLGLSGSYSPGNGGVCYGTITGGARNGQRGVEFDCQPIPEGMRPLVKDSLGGGDGLTFYTP